MFCAVNISNGKVGGPDPRGEGWRQATTFTATVDCTDEDGGIHELIADLPG